MESKEIREIFFTYFQEKGHYKVLSAPLVPAKDPTILFTNAGMNQFKNIFLGNEKRDYSRAVSIQKCMRVSGKHNDFDEVGRTNYHHTFFEMLGNFSFGDYFKEKAIEFAWELMIDKFKFHPDKLWVSVFNEDDEAYDIWENKIGIPPSRIARLGEKDNFWQMGNTGPCGPCSEIHYDRGKEFGSDVFTGDNKRFVEVWNLVFMQYFKDNTGKMTPLPSPSIDTGMGLERLTTLLSGKSSNYETDLFRPIIEFTAELAGINPEDSENKVALNVIADHIRALSFLISDGVLPSNDGRGYILRRILRRASKHGRSIGFNRSFLHDISPVAVELMKGSYPELGMNKEFISEVIKSEEKKFERTLVTGLKRFEEILQRTIEEKKDTISGKEIFRLSDTYGFPVDFSVDLATEKNIKVDLEGFRKELSEQQENSRKGVSSANKSRLPGKLGTETTTFTGYFSLEEETEVSLIYHNSDEVEFVSEGEECIILLKKTPFYGESGGQSGDSGKGESENALFSVIDTKKNIVGGHLHYIKILKGKLKKGDVVRVSVDKDKRENVAVHHSSTHLLHAALREVLGTHIKQSGSYVGSDKLRFDFTHFKPVGKDSLREIELLINKKIRENMVVKVVETSYEEAVKQGAIAIFDEKYSDRVRMVKMGTFSNELCGGTHLSRTGEIGFLKILSESSVASGIRRIEAVAGSSGADYIESVFENLEKLESKFKHKGDKLLDFLSELEKRNRELEKRNKGKMNPVKVNLDEILKTKRILNGVPFVIKHFEEIERKILSTVADEVSKAGECVAILSANIAGKSAIVISVASDLTKKINASTLIGEVSSIVNGKGGGRKDFAQAGGERIGDVSRFRENVIKLLL